MSIQVVCLAQRLVLVFFCFFKFYLFIFRGEERGKERERNISVWLPLERPLLGTWPATQACALTGNRTGDPLVHRPALSPLSHTSQGSQRFLTGMILSPRMMSGDICACHTGGAPGIKWVGVRDAVQHPTVSRTAPCRITWPKFQQWGANIGSRRGQ